MSLFEIPLSSVNQKLSVRLVNTMYQLTVIWRNDVWVLDIATADGTAIVSGIIMAPGVDLLGAYAYVGFGGRLVVLTAGRPLQYPTFAGLGTESRLYFITDD